MTMLIDSPEEIGRQVRAWRREGLRVALVPTMGALHAGHLSLMHHARGRAEKLVVSIFVNPLQFGPNEDFEKYPRREAEDIAKVEEAAVDALYLPGPGAMYPEGFATKIHVAGLGDGLCGKSRPGHFDGVATVVTKLLLQVLPDEAVFGEKDYQQLQIIRRMVRDLNIPVEVTGAPTVREADGLALSSRNVYLSPQERKIAPALHGELEKTLAKLKVNPDNVAECLAEARGSLLEAGFTKVDYLELCDAADLTPLTRFDRPARLLAAAFLSKTRLIDNIAAEPS